LPDGFRAQHCEPAHNLRLQKPMLTIRGLPHGGAVAQLGERLVRNEKVRSSILLGSTNSSRFLVDRQQPLELLYSRLDIELLAHLLPAAQRHLPGLRRMTRQEND
jgi:hypothetical protein